MKYTVYIRTNVINGKQYVGQTSNIIQRNRDWNCLKKSYANPIIDSEREKYGRENFKMEILAEVDNRNDADLLEDKFIKEFDTIFPNGYNMQSGGRVNFKFSQLRKEKMSIIKKGKQYRLGKKLSDESKQKIAKKHFKKVYKYSIEGNLVSIYPSVIEAAREMECSTKSISDCLRGKYKTCKGYKLYYEQQD